MRILLISGIIFVHVPHDQKTSPFLGMNGVFDWGRVFLRDSLFRIGVPCLSIISGYLLFQRGADTFDYLKTLRGKSRTVLLPFVLWNLALFVPVLLVQRFGVGIGYFPDLWTSSGRKLLTYAAATEGMPIDIPLYFLRDLLVCIILSPLLVFLVRRYPAPTLGVLLIVAVLPDVTLLLVLKNSILFSFALGIFLALRQADLKALDRFAVHGTLATLTAAIGLSIVQYWTGPSYPWAVDLARNTLSIFGAAGFWLLSSLLVKTQVGQRLASTGSLSFWIFCAHYPLLVAMWMVWNRVAGEELYPVFYIGAVLASFAILVTSNRLVLCWLPDQYELLTGGRGRKAKVAAASGSASAAAFGKTAITKQHR